MTTLLDLKKTLAYLGYLGYDGAAMDAIKISKMKFTEKRKNRSSRNVFHCPVFGATGCGKVSTCP
jgi:Ras family protein T1